MQILGFDEQSGNYQSQNEGTEGIPHDPIILRVQSKDPSVLNNARFQSAKDGSPGRIFLSINTHTSPHRDAGVDNDILFHELGNLNL